MAVGGNCVATFASSALNSDPCGAIFPRRAGADAVLVSLPPLPLPVLYTSLLWVSLALIAVSQFAILRSTVRAMRAAESPSARRGIEWAYAVVPAVALVVALVFTWQAAADHALHRDMEARASQTVAP